ncbi:MAG: type II toxin-antitoxin system prevent-host-death family antitoxin [Sulfurimonas sp.]|nr:MAG: type II toxin-antitoxin system prevent-host-death family antitoxin [Sulfurimonas sp.]
MQTTTFSQTRQHLASTMDAVVANHNPITITRQNKEAVVMISLQDFQSMQETAYLMQSSNNASRLNEAIEQLESGFGQTRDLIES